ncbi:MAG: lamin tail domain-containing protein [Clostridiales bacterium]|jgi:hypothetical protein|nr:lamin tail domain-containing protein [Clostridiales bacterium]
MNIKKTTFKGIPGCFRVASGDVEIVVTTEFGPRILYLGRKGGVNHLAVFEEDLKNPDKEAYLHYGGHRLWHAPEAAERTYVPANDKVEVKIDEKMGVIMLTAPVEALTGLQKVIIIKPDEEPGNFVILHRIFNRSPFAVELSAWAITMLAPGGLVVIPNSESENGYCANRALSLWKYSKLNDPRVYLGDGYVAVTNDAKTEAPFKIGSTVDDCFACYFNHGELFVKYFPFVSDKYPSYDCNFETYTCRAFSELESLSPLTKIEPGDFAEHMELWELHPDIERPDPRDEEAICEILDDLRFEDECEDEDCDCHDHGHDDDCGCGQEHGHKHK